MNTVRVNFFLLCFVVLSTSASGLVCDFEGFDVAMTPPMARNRDLLGWSDAHRADAQTRADKAYTRLLGNPESALSSMSKAQRAFVHDVLLPSLFARGILRLDANGDIVERQWKVVSPTELHLEEPGEIPLRIQFGADVATPQVLYERDHTLLRLPKGFDGAKMPPEERAGVVRRFLQGHSLHPYILREETQAERVKLTGWPLELKAPQLDALAAATSEFDHFTAAPSSHTGRIAIVGSTASGKTRVAMELSDYMMQHSERKLHIVQTQELALILQLRNDWLAYRTETTGRARPLSGTHNPPFIIAQFARDGMRPVPAGVETVADLAALETLVANSRVPVLLFSGGKQLREAVNAPTDASKTTVLTPEEIRLLRITGSMTVDEAHDLGDPIPNAVMTRWKSSPNGRFFLAGFTATPSNHIAITATTEDMQPQGLTPRGAATTPSAVATLFGDRIFWAGVDNPNDFHRRTSPVARPPETTLTQMAEDARLGRTLDFFRDGRETVKVLPTNELENQAGGRRNQAYFNLFAGSLRQQFDRHDKGLIFAGDQIADANALLAAAQAMSVPGKNFAVLHSGLSRSQRDEVMRRFRLTSGPDQIHFVIVVDMLGQGFNLPELSLLVDASSAGNHAEVIQHFGRVLRPAKGKREAEIIVAQRLNEGRVAELLRMYADLIKAANAHGGSGGGGTATHPTGPSLANSGPIPLSQLAFWDLSRRIETVMAWSPAEIRKRADDFVTFYKTHKRLPILDTTTSSTPEGELAIDMQTLSINRYFAQRLNSHLPAATFPEFVPLYKAVQDAARPQVETRLVGIVERMRLAVARYQAAREQMGIDIKPHVNSPWYSVDLVNKLQLRSQADCKSAALEMEAARREFQLVVKAFVHDKGGGAFHAGVPKVLTDFWTEAKALGLDAMAKDDLGNIYFTREARNAVNQARGHVKEGWDVELPR